VSCYTVCDRSLHQCLSHVLVMPKPKHHHPTHDIESFKDKMIQSYANWNHARVLGNEQALKCARQMLLACAREHDIISNDGGEEFDMLTIKTYVLNGCFDPEYNAECIKMALYFMPYLSAGYNVLRNPALTRFLYALYTHCNANNLSFNLLDRAHRKLMTRTIAYDPIRLEQIASSSHKLKVFVTELNNKD
jgi:hypothetical protein